MKRPLVVALLLAAACSNDDPAGNEKIACANFVDCPNGYTCSAGLCVVSTDLVTGLSASAGTVAFDAATTAYAIAAPLSTQTLTVTATTVDGATLTIAGVSATSGAPSQPIVLALGETAVPVVATRGEVTSTYTLTVTRAVAVAQQAYLKATNAQADDQFGTVVAVSGNTLVVGVSNEGGDATSTAESPNDDASGAGAVYVFVREGTAWTQQAYLKASNAEAGDSFGVSVAISGDTLVVGAYGEDGDASSTAVSSNNNALSAGAAYVFVRSGTTWTQQAYLKAETTSAFAFFGYGLAIDGDNLLVGAIHEDSNAGSIYVFSRSGTAWSRSARLTPATPAAGALFGATIAIDADTFVASAQGESAAYVFTRSGATWTQQSRLTASNGESGDAFGRLVVLDHDTVVVSAFQEQGDSSSTLEAPNNNLTYAGAAYVYVRNGVVWTQQAYLKSPNARTFEQFSHGLAISGDLLAIGAPGDSGDTQSTLQAQNTNAVQAGAVYVYIRTANAWTVKAYLKASNAEKLDFLGASVAMGDDFIACGAQIEDGDASSTSETPNNAASDAGAAYVFSF